jgi:hypothetical protein
VAVAGSCSNISNSSSSETSGYSSVTLAQHLEEETERNFCFKTESLAILTTEIQNEYGTA